MKEYVWSVLCAALFSGMICILSPQKKDLSKYVSFAAALAVTITLLTPVAGDFKAYTPYEKNTGKEDSSRYTALCAADILCTVYGIEKSDITALAEVGEDGSCEMIELKVKNCTLPGKETAKKELCEMLGVKIIITDEDESG